LVGTPTPHATAVGADRWSAPRPRMPPR